MICQRCNGTGKRRDWLVAGRIGKAYIRKPHLLWCWRCGGRGHVKT